MIGRHVRTYFKAGSLLCFIFLSFVIILSYVPKKQNPTIIQANIATIIPEIMKMITTQSAKVMEPVTTKSTKFMKTVTTNSAEIMKMVTTKSTNIIKPIANAGCVPYTVPDSRPFFEREPPQLNLPRKISYSSDKDLLSYLQTLRLFVLTTGRNVADRIDNFRNHIEPIVDLFHPSSRILICESDSHDNTVDKLYQWSRAQVYTYGNLVQSYLDRTKRIAFCRNKLLNLTHEMTSDYILMVDMDMFASNISTFLTNFQYNTDDWSVMTASSRGDYYDIWALRTLSDSNHNFDCWHRIWRFAGSYCHNSVFQNTVAINQKHIPTDRGLIEVRSAFNVAGLYKTNITRGCQYSGAGMACEHVPFHACIREKNHGRIFINPAFTFD